MAKEKIDEKENQKIVSSYRSLLKACQTTTKKEDIQFIRKAFNVALTQSAKKKDFLNEGYIFYPLNLARYIAKDLGLGSLSISCCLLYHFVKDGDITIEYVKAEFGDQAAHIIEGLVKISSFNITRIDQQADTFRKFIFTISSDIRVVIIKLAERLYIIRHLDCIPTKDHKTIASEVSILYAPLAHRLGLYAMKTEMDDLALRYREPEVYKNIETKLFESTLGRNRFIRKFIQPIKDELVKRGFDIEIKGRTKSIYSIWNKMKQQQVEFDEIFDIFAIRIILNKVKKDEKTDCWAIYSVVTNFYQPNPTRMRDWISVPKSNGYESLHTTVFEPGGKWVEVQIRTHRMDEVAEKGLAAHWKYKGGRSDAEMEVWLNRVREILETPDTNNTAELIDNLKVNLYEDEVFVFTPKGDLKKYPKGATVLDFAFDIHSAVGAACTGARINNKNVPIRYVLHNGDHIEILTSKAQKPKSDWLDIVITTRAKGKIKQLLRDETYKESDNGKEILKRRLKNWKIVYNDENVNKLLKHFGYHKSADFYVALAEAKIDLLAVKEVLVEQDVHEHLHTISNPVELDIAQIKGDAKKQLEDHLVLENSLENVDYKLARCCNPILGDEIFGFVTVTDGIKIHRTNCPNARMLLSKYSYRIINAHWTGAAVDNFYETILLVEGIDDMGIVNGISNIISNDLKVNMKSISFASNNGQFNGKINIMVKDKAHLNTIMDKIQTVKGVLNVTRFDEF